MSMSKPHFKIIHLSTNQGHGVARRVALAACTHELVALMDADDISVPTRFETQLAAFSVHPQADIIGGQITEFASDPAQPTGLRQVPLTDADIKSYLKKRCPFNQMSVMFKKSFVEKVGGYQDWYCDEDYYLWARMALKGAIFVNVPDTLVNVRTGNEMSARRGGWRYFKSETALQVYLWANNLINLPRLVYNVWLRFGGEVLLPNRLRIYAFKLLRKKPVLQTPEHSKNVQKGTAYPPFSVAMCVYGKDNPTHFKTALDSIINQTVSPAEIVLVADGPLPPDLKSLISFYQTELGRI